MSITLEPVIFTIQTHLSQWYQIRSEVSVRYGCRSVKKITPSEHRVWWEASMKNKGRQLFFIREGDDKHLSGTLRTVGILRLDHRVSWMEVWLAVKPEERHRKIATRALALISEKAWRAQWPPLGGIVSAEKNMASWRLFTRAGFITPKSGFVQLLQRGRHT